MSFKWESEKIAEWRLKARHDGLDENERLLYQDYQQTLALAEAEADGNASETKFMGKSSERRLEKGAILRGVMSLALVALIGMYVMTGCKLWESLWLVPCTTYEINYKLTGELPDANKVWSDILDTAELLGGNSLLPVGSLPSIPSIGGGGLDLGPFLQDVSESVRTMRESGRFPDQCFFDEVVSGLRGTSDMTEVHRHIWNDEAMWNAAVHWQQKKDPSYDPGPYVPYDGSGSTGRQTIEDLGNG